MPQRLMILGAGVYQIPAIQKAREQGLGVVACSYDSRDPGMALADFAENVDIVDQEGVLRAARKHNIDGIMTVCSDVGIPSVGYVNDQMGLSGIGLETALRCSSKLLMKEAFVRYGVTTPRGARVQSMAEALSFFEELNGPIVCKATDTSGSRGVVRAETTDEIPDAFDEAFQYTKRDFILIEEAIDGEEFGSQALVLGGKTIYNFCHNDQVTSGSVVTPVGHSYPFRGGKDIERLALAEVNKAVKALGLTDAQLNCDFTLRDGQVYVFEIGARVGATSLPQLTHCHTGLDWTQMAIDLALGRLRAEDLPEPNPNPVPAASTLIISPTAGSLEEIVMPPWLDADDSVAHLVVDIGKGDSIRKFRLGPDRIGEAVFVGDTLEDAEEKTKRFLTDLTIRLN